MKKILLLLSLFLLHLQFAGAQAPNWLWGETGAGSGFGYCSALAIDTSNHLFIAGRAGSTISLGGLTANTGGSTIPYMVKCDTSGLGIWLMVNNISGGSFDYPWGEIYVDNAGNSYSSGNVNTGALIYVDKYSKNGNLNWTYTTAGGNCTGYGVATDARGNVYNTGDYSDETIFGSDSLNNIGSDWAGYVAKFDSGGNVKWATGFYGTNPDGAYDAGKAIRTDKQGNVYVCGDYQATPVFYSANSAAYIVAPASSIDSSNFCSLFIAKYDSSGNILWVTTAGNAGSFFNDWSYWNFMTIDSFNNLYIAGVFEDTATFGTISVIGSTTNLNFFVAKFNTTTMQWDWVQTSEGTTGNSIATGLALDKKGNVYVDGDFTAPATFDSTTLSSGNIFVAKYANSTGALQWIQTGNIEGQTAGTAGIAVDDQNYVYVDGTYSGSGSTLGSISLQNAPGGSIFIAKLDSGSSSRSGSPYHPMFGYDHSWSMGVFQYVESPRSVQGNMVLTASGDTTISNTIYYKAIPNYYPQVTTYFREDTAAQKVWIRTQEDTDKLLYDFSLQTGDSVYLSFAVQDSSFNNIKHYYDKTGWYYVDSVNTINTYAGLRKALYLSNPNNALDTLYNDSIVKTELEWIEQIGSTIIPDYLQEDINQYNWGIYDGWPYYYIMLCSFDSSTEIYHNPAVDFAASELFSNGDSCEITSGINHLSVGNDISVYPNPSSDFIHTNIQLKNPSDLQLQLVNMLGQTVWSDDAGDVSNYQSNISVANLPDGVYVLEMVTGGGMESREVVVAK